MELSPPDDVFLQDDTGLTIAQHALQCSQAFQECMASPQTTHDPTIMDDQMARFTLWASNMDVFGPPNVSLDYRLRYSPTVVEIIHQLLDVILNTLSFCEFFPRRKSSSLCFCLIDVHILVKPMDKSVETPTTKKRRTSESGRAEVTKTIDYSSDTDSEGDQGGRSVSLITYTIGGTVSQLCLLSNAVRRSAKITRADKIAGYKADEKTNNAIRELRLYTECYIRFRFPGATEALCSALVEANALRLRRLCYQRAHRKRVALSFQRPQKGVIKVGLPRVPSRAPAVHFGLSMSSKPGALHGTSASPSIPPAPTTHATTAQQTAVRALYESPMTEVPRAKSVAVNSKLSLPAAPKTSECPYCGVILDFNGTVGSERWRSVLVCFNFFERQKLIYLSTHLLRDLEPFVCVFGHCTDSGALKPGSLTFDTSKAWLSHMQNAHGHIWECRAPSHKPITFQQEGEFQEHSHTEHDVPKAYIGTLSNAARRSGLQKLTECPFGDDFPTSEHSESNTVFASEALQLHVATHLKEISLLALQKLPCDGDDDSEDIASDLLSEDAGPARLRASMYSVLDDEALDVAHEADDEVAKASEEGITSSVKALDLEDSDETGMAPLHRAVSDINIPLAKSLIDRGADLRSKACRGKTALHFASEKASAELLKLLLDCDTRDATSLRDDFGQTALHYAAKNGFNEGITLLVDSGAFLDTADEYGLSPFLWAIIAGQEGAARNLLSLGADAWSVRADGKAALAWAASFAQLSIAKSLLEYGMQTEDSQSFPLHEASAVGDIDMVRLLLECGVDVNCRDRHGWLAIHRAAEEGHRNVLYLLAETGSHINTTSTYGTGILHCAANRGDIGLVRTIFDFGLADPDASTCHGWTALHHAAFLGHYNVVLWLMSHAGTRWTDGFYKDNHGWSALHLAVYGRHLDTVKVMLDHPMPSKLRLQGDESGLTAEDWLDFELDGHSYKTIGDLAFRKSRCCRTVTGLRQAARSGNITLAELLLQHGHDVNGTNSGGRTALYYAAKHGHMAMLDLLLRNGANPNLLPIGRRTWEGFILDEVVLQQLRRCGYVKPLASEELDQQIRLALREYGHPNFSRSSQPEVAQEAAQEISPLKQETSQDSGWLRREISRESGKGEATVKSDETLRTSVSGLWKRLRRQ